MISYQEILLLVMLTAATRGSCPSKCNCTDDFVTCVEMSLPKVPNFVNLPTTPTVIDLSGNDIDTLDTFDFSFDNNYRIQEIYLNVCKIVDIEEDAFVELFELQGLYLSDNILTYVPRNFISRNPNIILLDLSNNKFHKFPRIRSSSLEIMSLENSGIVSLENDALRELPKLNLLLLQRNNIKSLEPSIFSMVATTFTIKLDYNAWSCNCKTIQLFDFLIKRKLTDVQHPVQCLTEEKIFVDIYNKSGSLVQIKESCDFSRLLISGTKERYPEDPSLFQKVLFNLSVKPPALTTEANQKLKPEIKGETTDSKDSYRREEASVKIYYLTIFSIGLLLTFTGGLFLGAFLTQRKVYQHQEMKETDSSRSLLKTSSDVSV